MHVLICIIFQNILFSRKKTRCRTRYIGFYILYICICSICLNIQTKISGSILKNGNNHTKKMVTINASGGKD